MNVHCEYECNIFENFSSIGTWKICVFWYRGMPAITEEPVWFLGPFILLLSSPPVETQTKEFVFCCDIFGPVTFLEVLCGRFMHVCCD